MLRNGFLGFALNYLLLEAYYNWSRSRFKKALETEPAFLKSMEQELFYNRNQSRSRAKSGRLRNPFKISGAGAVLQS